MRIVLDSNILLVSIGKKSPYRPIWSAFIEEAYEMIVSEQVLYEYEEILQRLSAPGVADIVMNIFTEAPNVITQQVYYNWNAIKKDPDDNKFFDIAVAANADYLVTNDAHFNVLKQLSFPQINVITANEFLVLLDKQ
ncbi:putative toxin-antitoxin system toxin component, PIN family [Inquilinus sp. KBS0705]|nr:putative toxin-antitoxin system toxin component, PIN family [Inquilinus sp. KBS0705]